MKDKLRIAIIVPVSIYEPKEIIVESVKHLTSLNLENFEKRILYVFDGDENDERIEGLKRFGVEVLSRNTNRGKRAGAINDGLEYLKSFKPDFVAIFDIDSRPSQDFIYEAISNFKRGTYIVSARRYIYNVNNLISKVIDIEYRLINFFLKTSEFKQFNGLIGVLDANLLYRYRLNEDILTEDADYATRMYCLGYKATLCRGKILEQSPKSWKDFLNQRIRWYFGGLQLWKYFKDVLKSGRIKFISSWISALTLTYFPIIFLPIVLLSLPSLLICRKLKGFEIYLGFIFYVLILQTAMILALKNFLIGKKVEWKAMRR